MIERVGGIERKERGIERVRAKERERGRRGRVGWREREKERGGGRERGIESRQCGEH